MLSSVMAFSIQFEAKTANFFPTFGSNPVNCKTFLSLNFCHLLMDDIAIISKLHINYYQADYSGTNIYFI